MTEPDLTFNALVADLDYPMVVVTTAAGSELAGCLVGFATQCSIDPPRFLVCISKQNRTYRVARGAELLAVHFLPADATDLAELSVGRPAIASTSSRAASGAPAPAACRCWSAAATASSAAWRPAPTWATTWPSCWLR